MITYTVKPVLNGHARVAFIDPLLCVGGPVTSYDMWAHIRPCGPIVARALVDFVGQ